jgi:hypothetical protein
MSRTRVAISTSAPELQRAIKASTLDLGAFGRKDEILREEIVSPSRIEIKDCSISFPVDASISLTILLISFSRD